MVYTQHNFIILVDPNEQLHYYIGFIFCLLSNLMIVDLITDILKLCLKIVKTLIFY